MPNRDDRQRIELIDPHEPSGCGSPWIASTAPPAPPRARHPAARRQQVGAALAVAAIIGIVAAVATSGDDPRDRAAPTAAPTAPTPTAVTSTTVTSTTAHGGGPDGGHPLARLIGTLPSGYTSTAAFEITDAGDPGAGAYSPETSTSSALWADGPSATPGSTWLLTEATADESSMFGSGSVRIDTPRGPATVAVSADRISMSGPIDSGRATISSAGLTLGEVTHVLETTRLADGRIRATSTAVPTGLHLVGQTDAAAPPHWDPYTRSDAGPSTASSDPAGGAPDARLSVEAGPPLSAFQQTAERFFRLDGRPVEIGGRRGSLGTDQRDGRRSVSFDRDGLHVRVSAAGLDDGALLAFTRSLRPASPDEWAHHVREWAPPALAARPAAQAQLAGGDHGDGSSWITKFHPAAGSADVIELELDPQSAWGPRFGTAATLNAAHPGITAAASEWMTFVVAAAPLDGGELHLRVEVGGRTMLAPLVAAAGTTARLAIVAFTATGGYAARIVSSDGGVVAAYEPLSVAPS
ncbi:MAG: hypothetical protein JWM12_702 [Ilumatobacteraceae bacterium]|nr:hypothetical protein [Ilumatobacteraceae bacterium]